MVDIGGTEIGCPYVLLTLVRHGETPENKSDTFQGHMDTLLSEEGIKQVQLAGIKLQDEDFTYVFSSDLTRARETAEAIVKKSNFCSLIKIKEDSRLRERCYGEVEGCSKEQFRQMAAKNSIKPHNFLPKGAETLDQVRRRVTECFNSIIQEVGSSYTSCPCQVHEENCVSHQIKNGLISPEEKSYDDCKQSYLMANVLMVSHGGAIRQLLHYFVEELVSDFPMGSRRKMALVSPNTGISKFKIFLNEQTKLPEFVQCICLHNVDHLKESN